MLKNIFSIKVLLSFLAICYYLSQPTYGMDLENDPIKFMGMVKNELDIHGDGQRTPIPLFFEYFKRQEGDEFSLITQGAYRVFDVSPESSQVVILGLLDSSLGIVATDGKKLVALHKFSNNSLDHMVALLQENLDANYPENFDIHIYTSVDPLEWRDRSRDHENKGYMEVIDDVSNTLKEKLSVADGKQIKTSVNLNLRHQKKPLDLYDRAHMCVAVRLNDLFTDKKNLKFSSIDFVAENVFNITPQQCSEFYKKQERIRSFQRSIEQTLGKTAPSMDEKMNVMKALLSMRQLEKIQYDLYADYYPDAVISSREGTRSLGREFVRNYDSVDFFPAIKK